MLLGGSVTKGMGKGRVVSVSVTKGVGLSHSYDRTQRNILLGVFEQPTVNIV